MTDGFDDILNDETSEKDEEFERLLEDGDDEANDKVDDDVDYKDKYEKSEKSRRHQQKYVSKLQKEVEGLKSAVEKQGKSTEERNKKLAEALGFNNPDDEKAKQIVQEYEDNPVKFIQKYVDDRLNDTIPELDTKISRTSMKADVQDIMDEIESDYDVEFTTKFSQKVSGILRNFSSEYRNANRKEAILQATRMAMGEKPLKKRTENGIFVDNKGKITGFKGNVASREKSIKDGIKKAGEVKDIFA